MTLRGVPVLILFCLSSGLCPSAVAQDDLSTRSAPAQPSAILNWRDIAYQWVERRYKIEAVRFTARQESGLGFLGSDDVMVETYDADGWTRSDRITDIDSGDVHEFNPSVSCIVSVRAGEVALGRNSNCDGEGMPAPIRFRIKMIELDFWPFGFAVDGRGAHHYGRSLEGRATNRDDLIGEAQVDLTAQDLDAVLPNVGDTYDETVLLFPCGDDACGEGWLLWRNGDYTFTYRITRLADQRVDFVSILDAAMKRSGMATETEAVAAGLRALRAPLRRALVRDPSLPSR